MSVAPDKGLQPSSPLPVSQPFAAAWRHVLRAAATRNWLFNSCAPTSEDIAAAKHHVPLLAAVSLDHTHHFDVVVQVHSVGHAAMALIFAFDRPDPFLHALRTSDGDTRVRVRRMVVDNLPHTSRTFAIEFCWLHSGDLIVRFAPLSTTMNTAAFEHVIALAFTGVDAQILHRAANAQCARLQAGQFQNAGLTGTYARMEAYDTASTSTCAFCLSRGVQQCLCAPALVLRRRGAASPFDNADVGAETGGCWERFSTALENARKDGAYVYSWETVRNDQHTVFKAGIAPIKIQVQRASQFHPVVAHAFSEATATAANPYVDTRLLSRAVPMRNAGEADVAHSGPPGIVATQAPDVVFAQAAGVPLPASGAWPGTACVDLGRKRRKPDAQPGPVVSGAFVTGNLSQSLSQFVTPVAASGMSQAGAVGGSGEGTAKNTSRTNAKEKNGTNNRIYECPVCGVEIRNKKSNLSRHIQNKHTTVRQFECARPRCARKFQTRLNLNRHVRSMHDGRAYACERCSEAFVLEEELTGHECSAENEDTAVTPSSSGNGQPQSPPAPGSSG